MAGAGYKLFNTGDVLTAAQVNTYLMEQTVMVFANAAARTTALSGVVSEGMISYLKDTNAVEVYDGSNWVSSDDPNAIQNTIVDAKGDLIAASAADTPARLAVGNDGESLLADSSATTGLRWTATPNASNPVLNSSFDIWQRGTSVSLAASTSIANSYTADRFQMPTNANQACTVSRQATGDTTNLPNIQYCARFQRNSGQTGTGTLNPSYNLESADSIPFAGKTITFSFYARAGANYSNASSTLRNFVVTGTGTDQNLQNGYTGQATLINNNVTLTTTWQRFTATATVSSSATQIGFYFQWVPVGTAGANDYFEVTGIMINVGSTALPYRRNAATLAGELAACQRYYVAWNKSDVVSDAGIGTGFASSTTSARLYVPLPVRMRTTPSTVDWTAAGVALNEITAGYNANTVTFTNGVNNAQTAAFTVTVAGGLTQWRPYFLNVQTSTSFGIGAEL